MPRWRHDACARTRVVRRLRCRSGGASGCTRPRSISKSPGPSSSRLCLTHWSSSSRWIVDQNDSISSVIDAERHAAHRSQRPGLAGRCPNTQDVYWEPRFECTTVPGSGLRLRLTISSAATTSSTRMLSAIAHQNTRRENTSTTAARTPSPSGQVTPPAGTAAPRTRPAPHSPGTSPPAAPNTSSRRTASGTRRRSPGSPSVERFRTPRTAGL